MVGVDVLALGADSSIGHGVVDTDVVNVAGQGVIADLLGLGQVNLLQVGGIVEGHVADVGTGTQSNGLQVCIAGEGILADDGVVTDGQILHAADELIVEILLAVFVVVLDLEDVVNGHVEGKLFQSDIVADGHVLQLQTFAEDTFRHGHAVGDGYGSQISEGEGVLADLGIHGKLGHLGNAGLEEGILTDLRQLAQSNGGDPLGGAEGVIAGHGDLGQLNGFQLGIVGERAGGQSGDLCAANIGGSECTLHQGRYRCQGLAVGRQDVVSLLDLIGLVADGNLKGGDLGVPERELTDGIHIGADGYGFHILCLVEHALGQDGSIDIEGFQSFTAGEGVGTILDLGCHDGHILQLLAAGEGVLTDGQKAVSGLDALQLGIAGKGVVGNDADGA